MAARKKTIYEQQSKTVAIRATSRCSVKIKETFYTVEYCEERQVPTDGNIDINKERELLWNACNEQVDSQIEDIYKTFKK